MTYLRRFLGYGLTAAGGALLAGCLFHGGQAQEPITFSDLPGQPGVTNAPRSLAEAVRFQVGDQVTVTLTGPPDPIPPHQERIKEDGTITLNLIGPVAATNRTPGELQKVIHDLYVPQYYPRLTVTVTSELLVYFIGGEVKNPGRQIYGGKTTVIKAIQSAGDFTEFANKKKVKLTRADGKTVLTVNCVEALQVPSKDPEVFPGDQVHVPRRLF